jgi:hypothetical protein
MVAFGQRSAEQKQQLPFLSISHFSNNMVDAKAEGQHLADSVVQRKGLQGTCDLHPTPGRHFEGAGQFLTDHDSVWIDSHSANTRQYADSDLKGGSGRISPADLTLRVERRTQRSTGQCRRMLFPYSFWHHMVSITEKIVIEKRKERRRQPMFGRANPPCG